MNFEKLSVRFKILRSQFDAGIISYEAFSAALEDFTFIDDDGLTWKHGHDFGLWYFRNDGEWRRGQPSRSAREASEDHGVTWQGVRI